MLSSVWKLNQQGEFAFPIDFKDAYMHIPIVKCHFLFNIYLAKYTLSLEGFVILAGHSPRIFTSLTKAMLFLCQCKGLHIIHLDDNLILICSKHVGKRAFFKNPYWFS